MVSATTADVVIAGAGIAGIAAAIEAGERGANVVLTDADAEPGGTARASGGGMCIAGSPLQAARGITDSPELALADWLAAGGPEADAAWAQRYLEASAREVYEYLAQTGVEWVAARPQEGNSAARWHAPAGAGARVMELLTARARRCPRITWQLGTRTTALTTAGGAVTGVTARDAAGREVQYQARSVLLATGGFSSDPGLTAAHSPAARAGTRVLLAGGLGATGQGHRLLAGAGAQLVNMGSIWMYPYATASHDSPGHARGLVLRGIDGDVWVNAAGVRFHDESRRGGLSGAPAVLAQPGGTCWSVIDARIATGLTVWDPDYDPADRQQVAKLLATSPYVTCAPDLGALAAGTGLDPARFTETMREHNRARSLGLETDPDFGRPLAGLAPVDTPPFYGIQFFPAARKNLGGVATDENCQVLRPGGEPVPGLFAAGEVAGMAGGHVNGRAALEGTMLGPSLYSGRVAGRAV